MRQEASLLSVEFFFSDDLALTERIELLELLGD